jgi:DNA-binding NarL/FixJ family response regulator
VTAATEQRPDLVILDWEMPEMSGLEALREIRRTVPEAAVLMFSSKEEPGAAREALDSGAVRYFRKGTDDFDEVVAFAAGHTPA